MMKIRQLDAIPVRVPRLSRLLPKTAHGETTASDYVLIKLYTDTGIVGLGEVTCSPRWNGEEAKGTVDLVNSQLNDALRGLNPFHWSTIAARLGRVVKNRPFLRAALDMACLDASGKHAGVSAVDWLGGPVRQNIDTKLVLPARDVDTVASMALDIAQYSPAVVKLKVGTELHEDLDRTARVHHILGDSTRLIVDANEGWDVAEARRAIMALSDLGVIAVEQPLPRTAWNLTAQLRANGQLPLIADESVWGLHDILHIEATGAFDIVSLYPGKCGGLREAVTLAQVASAIGLAVTYGSNLELGIGSAALAHTIAATPSLSGLVPSDLIGPLYFETSLVQDDSFVQWGSARAPSGIGLGVALDMDAVERYRIDRE